jgi:hypothetical protein
MDIDNITPLVLHVTAKENIDISQDLDSTQNKSLNELIEDNTDEKEETENG